jgi:hypothetical protein
MRKGSLPAPRRCLPVVGRVWGLPAWCILVLLVAFTQVIGPVGLRMRASASEWKGQRVMKDGVLHVLNPAEPMEPPEVYDMQELWRLESETPEGDVVFGSIDDAAFDPSGNAYLLDVQLKTVHVISSDGKYIRSIGREGEGPGDLQAPEGILITHDGRLGITDDRPARLNLFALDGTPESAWTPIAAPGTLFIPFACRQHGDGFLLACKTLQRTAEEILISHLLGLFDATGHLTTVFWRRDQRLLRGSSISFSEEELEPLNVFAIDSAGCVYCAPLYSEYAIHVFYPDGTPRSVITRDFAHVRRAGKDISDMRAHLATLYRSWPNADIQVASHERDIVDLSVRPNGDLWVQTSQGWYSTMPGTAITFDVLDREGRFSKQAILRGEIDAHEDMVLLVGAYVLRLTTWSEQPAAEADSVSLTQSGHNRNGALVAICYQLGSNR